ncbi:hypothetical protein LR48_Vigan09g048000 [Vigna angularis]|uniref:Uncharacterized protein n=1 Tax=Phaseolus angularis TaxID=3914 RepID=A0A0L9V9R3_PHAAN|nr:hypothetical protein LR48_Vigan09g048000 [Vigna angularis]
MESRSGMWKQRGEMARPNIAYSSHISRLANWRSKRMMCWNGVQEDKIEGSSPYFLTDRKLLLSMQGK